ncbi:RNA polymerase sigma factor [Sphingomonas aracearum]|uniref:RNA polymerase sigma factor n=1 Tax=Sphingomonas aracearum TaxID=2283317 RepID=UPI0015F09CB6|nr:sigma-70 family RNA polymerase sigma factor [Sphingomonas aracearum]
MARRLRTGSDEPQDLVQDVFARMLTTEGWSAIANPRTYMLQMLRNIAIDRMRRAKIVDFRHFADADEYDLPDDAPDPHRIVEGRQQMKAFAEALHALPERCRVVFERRRIEGQSPRQIASELGVSLSTLEKRLARAIHLLTRALEPGRAGDASDGAASERLRQER